MSNKTKHKLFLLLYAIYVPIYIGAFFLVEKLVPETADYWVSYIFLDDYIPFREEFIIFYYLWYPALVAIGVFLLLKDEYEYKRYMISIMITFTFTLIFCLLVPNGQDLRPDVFPRENFFTDIVAAIYAADTNTNVMPSVHAIGAFLGMISTHRTKQIRSRAWIFAMDVLWLAIALSTCFVKQHSILDIFGSVAVCLVVYIARVFLENKESLRNPKKIKYF
ncbi:hypothetical protein HMPREF1635_00840 [Clostridiales bacterium S5-A14a]|nr:hypothetical protein HMPREF1635_00840 [Clostridiales bacterium S5-A14a]